MKLHLLVSLCPCLLLVALFLAAVPSHPAQAQSLDILEETLTATPDGYELEWHGIIGHTYFVQHSSDLESWTYLPFTTLGSNEPIKVAFSLPDDRLFVRVVSSESPPSSEPDDFDGDGIRDLTEIYFGLDPLDPTDAPADLDADTDGDGWHDSYELLFPNRSRSHSEEASILSPTPKTSLRVYAPLR